MKRMLLSFVVVCLVSVACAQSSLDEAWIKENYFKKEYRVPMRYGVKLFTSFYMPGDTSELHLVAS